MLRSSEVRPFLRVEEGRVRVDWLRDDGGRVEAYLDRLCRLVRKLEGRPRSEVSEALRRQERRVRDSRRLKGVSKSLLDRCVFRPPPGAEGAPEIRETLFRIRGRSWPPTPGLLRAPYEEAARELGMEPARVDRLLYADRPDARLLNRAPRWSGKRLLALYNLDLARGVLLDAVRVTVEARGRWGDLFRTVKLARLMYRVEEAEGGRYQVELTGPAAPFLEASRRYGSRFARVVPALTRLPGWRLEAELTGDLDGARFLLDGTAPVAGSRGRGRPRYDSGWERSLARDFAAKLGEERSGWSLHREATPLPLGGDLFLPDFTFRHRDGREVLVELVGFWTPEYLEEKLAKLRAADVANLLLVVYRGLAAGREDAARDLEEASGGPVVWFVKKPVIRDVMEAVERMGGGDAI